MSLPPDGTAGTDGSDRERIISRYKEALATYIDKSEWSTAGWRKMSQQAFHEKAERELRSSMESVSDEAVELAMATAYDDVAKERAEKILEGLKSLKETCDLKAAQVRGMRRQLEEVESFEFLSALSAGTSKLWIASLLDKLDEDAKELQETSGLIHTWAGELFTAINLPSRSETEEDSGRDQGAHLREVIQRYEEGSNEVFATFARVSRDLHDALSEGSLKITEGAVYNYLKSKDKGGEKLGKLGEVLQASIQWAKEIAPTGFKWIVSTVDLLKNAADRYYGERKITQQVREYQLQGAERIIADLNREPAAIAKALADTMKANTALLVKSIGIIGSDIPGWGVISPQISVAISKIAKEKISRAEALTSATRRQVQDFRDTVHKEVKEEFEEWMKDLKKQLINPKGAIQVARPEAPEEGIDPRWFTGAFEKAVYGTITRMVIRTFNFTPGQIVTGQDLDESLKGLKEAFLPREYFIVETKSARRAPAGPSSPLDLRDGSVRDDGFLGAAGGSQAEDEEEPKFFDARESLGRESRVPESPVPESPVPESPVPESPVPESPDTESDEEESEFFDAREAPEDT
ncbi:hypothetical protein [Streptomyces sp. NPDC048419]|uniref:hypothetical protein n=1 Tax=Streptomyces sp. NPDC048419 TaxID=3365547 RepID=UPI003721A9DF